LGYGAAAFLGLFGGYLHGPLAALLTTWIGGAALSLLAGWVTFSRNLRGERSSKQGQGQRDTPRPDGQQNARIIRFMPRRDFERSSVRQRTISAARKPARGA
jgi:hypothetical protein